LSDIVSYEIQEIGIDRQMTGVNSNVFGASEGMAPLGRPRDRWKDNIKIDV
jgi:hypothetical protein